MTKVRLKFSKGEPVKFISHLDLLRTFNRAFNRARLPIAYSQGFNPHPVISFALPLAVGVTSEAEYMDIELYRNLDKNEIMDSLNQALPQGISILDAVVLENGAFRSFNDIGMADYTVTVELKNEVNDEFENKLKNLLELDEIIVEKEGKKGVKQVNILPDIGYIKIQQVLKNEIVLKMRLKAGNESNLKPELVLKALEKYMDAFKIEYIRVHRTGLLFKDSSSIT